MSLFKIFSKDVDKQDSLEEKPKKDYGQEWWVETRHDGSFAVMHKKWHFVFAVYTGAWVHETKETMRFRTLDLAVAYCEDQVSKYEFKPETVWGPKP